LQQCNAQVQWVQVHIFKCEADTWPFARLADGQLTDVRPYMTWRGVAKGEPVNASPMARQGDEGAQTFEVQPR